MRGTVLERMKDRQYLVTTMDMGTMTVPMTGSIRMRNVSLRVGDDVEIEDGQIIWKHGMEEK